MKTYDGKSFARYVNSNIKKKKQINVRVDDLER